MKRRSQKHKLTRGQALTEYLLVMALVAGFFVIVEKGMPQFLNVLEKPIRTDFMYTYKYGDPKACGYDDTTPPCSGTPKRHPRYYKAGNFRIFGRRS